MFGKAKKSIAIILALGIVISITPTFELGHVSAEDDGCYLSIVDFTDTFSEFLPGETWGVGGINDGDGIATTNLVANTAMVSWWDSETIPANISTQFLYNKYTVSSNLNADFGAVVASQYGTMDMAVKLVASQTDSNASAVFALKNGSGVTMVKPITSLYADCQAVVLRLATSTNSGATGISDLYPGVYFELYEQKTGATDTRELGERFVRKSASALMVNMSAELNTLAVCN